MKLEETKLLVLSGGSILGLCYLGLFSKILEKYPDFLKNINEFHGTSIGAVVSVFLSLGCHPRDLFNDLKDIHIEPNLDILSFTSSLGLDSGESLVDFFANALDRTLPNTYKAREITLKQLFDITGKTVILTTCCVETGKVIRLSHLNFPTLKLIHALRMTTSIPFYFTPVIWKSQHFIDAGVIENFPFKPQFINDHSVLGVNLKRNFSTPGNDIDLYTYVSSVINLISTRNHHPADNVIQIEIPSSITNKEIYNFDVSPKLKNTLFDIGYTCIVP